MGIFDWRQPKTAGQKGAELLKDIDELQADNWESDLPVAVNADIAVALDPGDGGVAEGYPVSDNTPEKKHASLATPLKQLG